MDVLLLALLVFIILVVLNWFANSTLKSINLWGTFIADVDNILITTDLEPDDLIALLILVKNIPKDIKIGFVVGEGHSRIKYQRIARYCELMNFKNYKVFESIGSTKDFVYDGLDIFNSEFVENIRENNKSLSEINLNGLKTLKEFINSGETAIIMLKPPRELMEIWSNDNSFFNKTKMIGYMSFNLRSLWNSKQWSQQQVVDFLNSFESVIYYETFLATGEKNSMSKSTKFPFDKLPGYIKKLISLWNKSIMKECKKDIDNPDYPEANKARSRKIYDNIKADPDQFVNADCGLIASMLIELKDSDYYTGTINFNANGYSVPTKDPNGKIIFINPTDKEDLWLRQIEFYQNSI